VTAVEYKKDVLETYGQLFPTDELVHGDAIEYLENNFEQFDFIWASPPCPTHSKMRKFGVSIGQVKPVLPDMTLYGIIVFLKTFFKGLWCVENVNPYYIPLIKPSVALGRHSFWTNYNVPEMNFVYDVLKIQGEKGIVRNNKPTPMSELVENKKLKNKKLAIDNCVDSEIGKYLLECAENKYSLIELNSPLLEDYVG